MKLKLAITFKNQIPETGIMESNEIKSLFKRILAGDSKAANRFIEVVGNFTSDNDSAFEFVLSYKSDIKAIFNEALSCNRLVCNLFVKKIYPTLVRNYRVVGKFISIFKPEIKSLLKKVQYCDPVASDIFYFIFGPVIKSAVMKMYPKDSAVQRDDLLQEAWRYLADNNWEILKELATFDTLHYFLFYKTLMHIWDIIKKQGVGKPEFKIGNLPSTIGTRDCPFKPPKKQTCPKSLSDDSETAVIDIMYDHPGYDDIEPKSENNTSDNKKQSSYKRNKNWFVCDKCLESIYGNDSGITDYIRRINELSDEIFGHGKIEGTVEFTRITNNFIKIPKEDKLFYEMLNLCRKYSRLQLSAGIMALSELNFHDKLLLKGTISGYPFEKIIIDLPNIKNLNQFRINKSRLIKKVRLRVDQILCQWGCVNEKTE